MTTESLLERGQPSHTALRVASQRAAHQLLDEPIVLPDPIALPILGAQAEAAMREDPYAHNEPILRGLRASLVVRSRVAEDELARAVDAGVRQYVLLGAGLDTFAYRNPHAQVRVFEVDHPATQAWKRQCLHDADIALPSNLHFAPIDFERTSLADGLLVAGFDSLKPACFAWLGVTMYLTEAAIFSTLAYVASLPRGSSICFDYRVPEHRLDPVQKVIGALMASRAAAAGEPWISAFEPEALRERMLALGFAEVEMLEPDLLNARYLARRKDGLRSGGRMMLARV